MRRPNPLVPLQRIVTADAQLAAWNRRRLHEEAVLRAVRRLLPRPVAERVRVVDSLGTTLVLATSAGAIASVVRQRVPDLLVGLRRDGWEFNGIAVRVQPESMPLSSRKNEPRQWDSSTRRPLVALEANLSPGPLKAALGRLLRRG